MDEYPRGICFKTPDGEDDGVAMMQHHVQCIHKKACPKGVTRAQAMEHIKKIE